MSPRPSQPGYSGSPDDGDDESLDETLRRSGHDHHFLERLSRVEAAVAERAMALYRAPHVIEELSGTIAGKGRVALALDEGPDAPRALVEGGGRFVTCLGKGMDTELPLVPFERVQAALHREEREQQASARLNELTNNQRYDRIWHRVFREPHQLAREDLDELIVMGPVLGVRYTSWLFHAWGRYLLLRDEIDKNQRAALADPSIARRLVRLESSMGHLLVLHASRGREAAESTNEFLREEGSDFDVTRRVLLQSLIWGRFPLAMRALYAISRGGKEILPSLKKAYAETDDRTELMAVALALGAIGLRHSKLRAEIEAMFTTSRLPAWTREPGEWEGWAMVVQTLSAMLQHERVIPLRSVREEGPDLPAELLRLSLLEGFIEKGFIKQDPRLPMLRIDQDAERALKVWAFLREYGFFVVSDFPGDNIRLSFIRIVASLPLLVGASPTDFLVQRKWIDLVRIPDDTEAAIAHVVKTLGRQEPVKQAPVPGRNEPCSCGSGRKYKKCCGGIGKA